jgi:hypothetical protein
MAKPRIVEDGSFALEMYRLINRYLILAKRVVKTPDCADSALAEIYTYRMGSNSWNWNAFKDLNVLFSIDQNVADKSFAHACISYNLQTIFAFLKRHITETYRASSGNWSFLTPTGHQAIDGLLNYYGYHKNKSDPYGKERLAEVAGTIKGCLFSLRKTEHDSTDAILKFFDSAMFCCADGNVNASLYSNAEKLLVVVEICFLLAMGVNELTFARLTDAIDYPKSFLVKASDTALAVCPMHFGYVVSCTQIYQNKTYATSFDGLAYLYHLKRATLHKQGICYLHPTPLNEARHA